ncbi:MAG: 3-hydroxyacyl-[acyl-carrier-protein] dehydratase [Phycisphaerales bacterium]
MNPAAPKTDLGLTRIHATTMPSTTQTSQVGRSDPSVNKQVLLDLSAIDLSGTVADRAQIAEWIPHRHEMALLDSIVWSSDDFGSGVGRWDVREDEFWVRGHFPEKAMLPGVLQVEAGAQLACYLYNRRYGRSNPAAFLRIEEAVFRLSVEPGQQLLILCREIKCSSRRFITQIQGLINGDQVAFEGRIHGMNMQGRIRTRD